MSEAKRMKQAYADEAAMERIKRGRDLEDSRAIDKLADQALAEREPHDLEDYDFAVGFEAGYRLAFERTRAKAAQVLKGLQKTAYDEDERSLFNVIENVILDMPLSEVSAPDSNGGKDGA